MASRKRQEEKELIVPEDVLPEDIKELPSESTVTLTPELAPVPAKTPTMVEAMVAVLPEVIPEGPGVLFEYTYGGSPRWVFMDVDHLSVHAAIAAAKEAKPGATPEELISALGGLVGDRGRLFRRVSVIKL